VFVIDHRPEMSLVRLAIVGLDVGADIDVRVGWCESLFDLLNTALFLAVFFCGLEELEVGFGDSIIRIKWYFSSKPKELRIKESVRELFFGSESFLLYLSWG
jgi:hypothetical protein